MPILKISGGGAGGGVDLPEIGLAVATWISPDGTSWPLTDPNAGWFTLSEGVSGLDAAEIDITRDKRARGGVKVRHNQPAERNITWTLAVFGSNHTEFITRWRALMNAFTQTSRLGPGWLIIARPDGSARRIQAYYQDGFKGSGQQGFGVTDDYCAISLLCEDAYWQDITPQRIVRGYAVGADFLDPYPTVSSAHVLGATELFNPGDVEAYPQWTITGPASSMTATLNTTGHAFTLDPDAPDIGHGDLLVGEQVLVSIDPPRVRFENGDVWTAALNWPGATLWPLPPGLSQVTFALAGSGAGSQVELIYYPRYESA